MRINKGAAMTAEELRVDPWATVYCGDVSRESPVSETLQTLCSDVVGLRRLRFAPVRSISRDD
jgi:hypothetical protein